MGRHMAIDGVAEDHDLVTHGPYRYVRHPIYASLAAIALGTALVFRSFVVLGLSVMLMVSGRWWANAEESLLGSADGFGDVYRTYAARTGRFFPRLKTPRSVPAMAQWLGPRGGGRGNRGSGSKT